MGRGRYPRRLKIQPPDEAKKEKYLSLWFNKDLYHNSPNYPRINSQNLFGNDKPLELDVGCGTGEFICQLAAKQPEINFIGIDVAFKPMYRAVETAAAESLDNIRFIRADINLMYPLLRPESLSKVYFHFPIPIRKSRHKKHIIFTPVFLDYMHTALVPDGRISVMSDARDFFEELKNIARQDSRFIYIPKDSSCEDTEDTKDELKTYCQFIWEKRGCPTYRFELKKHNGC